MNVELVSSSAALEELCARIAAAPRIALDTEFHTEKHFTPKLMVVQVAFDDAARANDARKISPASARWRKTLKPVVTERLLWGPVRARPLPQASVRRWTG